MIGLIKIEDITNKEYPIFIRYRLINKIDDYKKIFKSKLIKPIKINTNIYKIGYKDNIYLVGNIKDIEELNYAF